MRYAKELKSGKVMIVVVSVACIMIKKDEMSL